MTAIGGFWSLDGRPSFEACERILAGQSAYGDAPVVRQAGAVTIGRALHRTVPEDSWDRGPLNDGPSWLVADIRLDNRTELAAALGLNRNDLSSMADAALLHCCLIKWDAAAVDRLVGEFAFAWWNEATRELLLARDFVGMRPLYFHRAPGSFAFASMPSGLQALPHVPNAFDPDFMAESLALLPRFGSKTWFKDIERVEPAHLLRVKHDSIQLTRYWTPDVGPRARTASEYEEGLRTVFDEAVGAQLRGTGDKIGSHLSSGLDSPVVTATAARLFSPNKVIAFTAVPRAGFAGPVPPNAFADEGPLAALTAALYPNVEHVRVETSTDSLLDPLDREHFYQQQPIANLCNAMWSRAINRQAHERGLKVLLTGAGGNMSISYGGLEELSQLIASGRLGAVARLSRGLATNGISWAAIAAQIAGPLTPWPLWQLALKMRGRPSGIAEISSASRALATELERRGRERRMDIAFRPVASTTDKIQWVLAREDGGNYFKGVLAEWGISMRDPTLDKRVIEYSLTIPSAEFVRGGVHRSLGKRAFRDRLPREVIEERAHGYQSADWFETIERELPKLKQEVAAIRRCESAADALEVDLLERAIADWPSGEWDRDRVIMRFRWGLLRTISAGHFMRKVARTN